MVHSAGEPQAHEPPPKPSMPGCSSTAPSPPYSYGSLPHHLHAFAGTPLPLSQKCPRFLPVPCTNPTRGSATREGWHWRAGAGSRARCSNYQRVCLLVVLGQLGAKGAARAPEQASATCIVTATAAMHVVGTTEETGKLRPKMTRAKPSKQTQPKYKQPWSCPMIQRLSPCNQAVRAC